MTPAQREALRARDMSPFARTQYEQKYAMRNDGGEVVEDWDDTALRVTSNVLGALGYNENDDAFQTVLRLIRERKFLPGGRYLYASGRDLHQTQNCLLLRAEDSREGWADLSWKAEQALMTGAGIGVDYSALRERGSLIKRTGGVASGPLSKMNIINEIGREVMMGGARRSAIWAGLRWDHPDCFDFCVAKNWSETIRKLKEEDFNFPAPLDMTNISVIFDREFFDAYEDPTHAKHKWARDIYSLAVSQMVGTAEPGLSIDYENAKESLRNACTEIVSEDDSDICNLGSINLARIENIEEMKEAVRYGTLFLLAGTVYSHLPYKKVDEVRRKNRRLGLGLMGVHEWLLQRGKSYGPDDELAEWLDEYAKSTDIAFRQSFQHCLTAPVKTRAIAPTGTIGIIGETTTGIEPIYAVAFKRRYKESSPFGDTIKYQYVVDPTARRLIEDYGVDPHEIEDAYMLSYNVERRVAFQAWIQQWVDHGISSTINLPYPILDPAEVKDFADMLYGYLPKLRGITAYPDGARGGQPLTVVPYEVACAQEGVVFEESDERCKGGSCGV